MVDAGVTKKLALKAGMTLQVLNAPPDLLQDLLSQAPTGVLQSSEGAVGVDCVLLFVRDRAEYDALNAQAIRAVRYDGLLWLVYPKKSSGVKSDLSRDVLWRLMEGTGLRPVTNIAIDETWSGLRFRPVEKVKG